MSLTGAFAGIRYGRADRLSAPQAAPDLGDVPEALLPGRADLGRLVEQVQRSWIAFIHGESPGWRRYDQDSFVHHFA
ncbi:hypothetical protein AB0L53_39415 [Nonomuraea sp. NPDC052129]|uniref:hypothetical protein n=1 Tax=Nonomuraea sp. NPDC052129 TaxID=3154651 RepID=UPI003430362A